MKNSVIKSKWRILSAAMAMVVLFSMPLPAFADNENVIIPGPVSGLSGELGVPEDPDAILPPKAPSEDDPDAVPGASGVWGIEEVKAALLANPPVEFRASVDNASVLTGDTFTLNVGYKIKSWPTSENYGITGPRNLLESVDNIKLTVSLPEGVSYVGTRSEDEECVTDGGSVITIELPKITNTFDRTVSLTLAAGENYVTANKTKYNISASMACDMNAIPAWTSDAEHEASVPVATTGSAALTVEASAYEYWAVEKEGDGKVGEINDSKVKFSFETHTGAKNSAGKPESTPSEGIYNRFGRLPFAEDGYKVDEKLSASFKYKLGDETKTVELSLSDLAPTAVITDVDLAGGGFSDAEFARNAWQSGGKITSGGFHTATQYNMVVPNPGGKPSVIGKSPTFTKYKTEFEYSMADIRAAAKANGVPDGVAFDLYVKSTAELTYKVGSMGGSYMAEAAQYCPISATGGGLEVRVGLYGKRGDTSVVNPYNDDKAAKFPATTDAGFFKLTGPDNSPDSAEFLSSVHTTAIPGEYVYSFAGLKPGTYTLSALGGVAEHDFVGFAKTTSQNNPTIKVTITDSVTVKQDAYFQPLAKNEILIHKQDSYGGNLQGAKFALYAMPIGTAKVDAYNTVKTALDSAKADTTAESLGAGWQIKETSNAGVASFTDLLNGTYYMFELPLDGYMANTKIYTLDITGEGRSFVGMQESTANGTPEGEAWGSESNPIINTSTFGQLKFQKRVFTSQITDSGIFLVENNTAVSSFAFQLWIEENGALRAVTDKNGVAVVVNADGGVNQNGVVDFGLLEAGTYWAQELDAEGWNISIKENRDPNTPNLSVTDKDGVPGMIGPFTVQNGKAIGGINGADIIVQNTPNDSYALVKKTKDNGKTALAGATFEVREKGTENVLKFALSDMGVYIADPAGTAVPTSGKSGQILFAGLEKGKAYTITELAAPQGWEKSAETFDLKLINSADYKKQDGAIDTTKLAAALKNAANIVVIKNTQKLDGLAKITKIGSGLSIGGTEFAVYIKNSDNTYSPLMVDNTPVTAKVPSDKVYPNFALSFTPKGAFKAGVDYFMVETKAAPGYLTPTPENTPEDKAGKIIHGMVGTEKTVLFGPYTTKTGGTIINQRDRDRRGAFLIRKLSAGDPEVTQDTSKNAIAGAEFAINGRSVKATTARTTFENFKTPPKDAEMTNLSINPLTLAGGWTYVEVEIPADVPADATEFEISVQETRQPTGYALNDISRPVTVGIFSGNGMPTIEKNSVTMENYPLTSLSIEKFVGGVGSDKKFEQKTVFVLYEAIVGNWSQRDSLGFTGGPVSFKELNAGAAGYAITEDAVPGYVLAGLEAAYGDEDFVELDPVTINTNFGPKTAYILTDLAKKNVGKTGDAIKPVRLRAYNVQSTGRITLNKKNLDKDTDIPKAALEKAHFDAYEIHVPQGESYKGDEYYQQLTTEGITAAVTAGELKLSVPGVVTADGIAVFDKVARFSKGENRYLIVETEPPEGYALVPEAYGDGTSAEKIYAMNSKTRAVATVNFDGNVVETEVALHNAPLSNVVPEKIELVTTITSPSPSISKPLQELGKPGQNITFTLANNTTLPGYKLNAVPLYDYTVSGISLKYLSEQGNEITPAEYEIRSITIPAAYYSADGVRQYAEAKVYAGQELLGTSTPGEDYRLELLPDSSRKNLSVVYSAPGSAPDAMAMVGESFFALPITVSAHLFESTASDEVRQVAAQAELSFKYYTTQYNSRLETKKATDEDVVSVAQATGYPEIAVTKAVTIVSKGAKSAAIAEPEGLLQAKAMSVSIAGEDGKPKTVAGIGDTISYTVEVRNASDKYVFKQPVVVDPLAAQVEYTKNSFAVSDGLLKQFKHKPQADSQKQNRDVLVFYLKDLKPGQSATITFKGTVRQAAATMSAKVDNEVFVTSNEEIKETTLNPSGQVFRNLGGLPPVVKPEISKMWDGSRKSAYVPASQPFDITRGGGWSARKYVVGESEFRASQGYKTSGDIAYTTRDGRVFYKITLVNGSGAPADKIRAVDLLPQVGDDRGSMWRPILVAMDGNPAAAAYVVDGSNKITKTYAIEGSLSAAMAGVTAAIPDAGAPLEYDWAGWTALDAAASSPVTMKVFEDNKEVEKAAVAYNDVMALGFELEQSLPAGESLQIEISMKAPGEDTWPDMSLVANTPAVNLAKFAANNGTLGTISIETDKVNITTRPTVDLGDTVWMDSNNNGIQDAGERGIEGVSVTLKTWKNGSEFPAEKTTTDLNGKYNFRGLATSEKESTGIKEDFTYQLVFEAPELKAAEMNKGGNTLDSDANDEGKTQHFRFGRANGRVTTELLGFDGTSPAVQQSTMNAQFMDDSFDAGMIAGREITVKKTDARGGALGGARFELSGGGSTVSASTDAATGLATFKNLDVYTEYTLKETEAPSGYILPETPEVFTFAAIPSDASLTAEAIAAAISAQSVNDQRLVGDPIENTRYGQLTVKKVQTGTDTPLAGVVFSIFDTETGGTPIAVLPATNDKGEASYGDLAPGVYFLEEDPATVPELYLPLGSRVRVVITDGASPEVVVEIGNDREGTGKISIVKTDKDDSAKLLAGAEFSIGKINAAGNLEAIQTIVTDEKGYAISGDLKLGEYILTETKAPEGYSLLGGDGVKVTIATIEETVRVEPEAIANTKKLYEAYISKEIVGAPLVGAQPYDEFTFELYAAPGGVVDESTVLAAVTTLGNKGDVQFKIDGKPAMLAHGEYAIKESIVYADVIEENTQRYNLISVTDQTGNVSPSRDANGYWHFKLGEETNSPLKFTAVNQLRVGELKITKKLVDNKKPLLESDMFDFEIYPTVMVDGEYKVDTGAPVAQAAIRAGETYSFTGLPVGRYAVAETGMNAGYSFKWWGQGTDKTITSKYLLVDIAQGSSVEYTAVNDVMDVDVGTALVQKKITDGANAIDRATKFTFAIFNAQKDEAGNVAIGNELPGRRQAIAAEETAAFTKLSPGLYAIAEMSREGYTLAGFTGGRGEQITVNGAAYFVFEVTLQDVSAVLIEATNNRLPEPEIPTDPIPDPDPVPPTTPIPTTDPTPTPTITTPPWYPGGGGDGDNDNDNDPPNYNGNNTPSRNRPRDLITIEDEQVPLAKNPLMTIDDEPVPLGRLPYTGGFSLGQLIPYGVLIALAGYLLSRKRKLG